LRAHVEPHWIYDDAVPSDRFWYRSRTRQGAEFVLVDPHQGSREPAFDHDRLAAALSLVSGTACEGYALPFSAIEFSADGSAVRFNVNGTRWSCDLETYACTALGQVAASLGPAKPSPDGRWLLLTKEHNLVLREVQTGEESALTDDGEPYLDYASSPEANVTTVTNRRQGVEFPPAALWSPDSKRFITHRLDQRRVKDLYLLQSVPDDGSIRPILHSYRYPMLGDEHVAQAELLLFDVEQGTVIQVDYPPLPTVFYSLIERGWIWWSDDGENLYFVERPRGERKLRLVEIDAKSGATRVMVDETCATRAEPNLWIGGKPNMRVLPDCQVVWFSERDGWGHLYLYDGESGELMGQITSGPWVVADIARVDLEGGWLYFTGGGREPGRDPYYHHLYRVRLDGSDLELLTPEEAHHEVTMTPSGRFFLDTHGRVDRPPVSVLRTAAGELVCQLEEADFGRLQARGWRWPERFTVKARDGTTDLYGLIYHPTKFDPTLKYPVVDSIYGGSQLVYTPKSYPQKPNDLADYWFPQTLAELGFVVVVMDGLGTPFRSRAFHDHSFYDHQDMGQHPCHIAGIQQLAAERPYMDLSKVGVFGLSAGGYAAARAVLAFPDFYHVAVSSAGAHDMRCYLDISGESGAGSSVESYMQTNNARDAANLKGKLLLVHGDMDDNVHPAVTMKLVNALIEANKDFDLLIFPGRSHNFTNDPYFVRRLWDYFVRHLLGVEPPRGYRVGDPTGAFAPWSSTLTDFVKPEKKT
jgi:dipeptidyl aminopeptidase/acylaminoacyl peptidase